MQKLFVSLSAIPISLYRSSIKGLQMENPNLYSDIFSKYGSSNDRKTKNRIYIPLNSKPLAETKSNPNPRVLEFLRQNKFKLDNYRLGTAIMPDGKRTTKIGKVLSKEPELKKLFDNDPSRSGATQVEGKMLCVISRHPYDILGISFDRGWTSCTNLDGGENAGRLKDSIKFGLLVAYLVRDTDKNINKPIARILIRPYFNKEGNVILSEDGTEYGSASASFRHTVRAFLLSANSGAKKGKYFAPKKMYLDEALSQIWHGLTEEDVTDAIQVQYITDTNSLLKLAQGKENYLEAVMWNRNSTLEILRIGIRDKKSIVRLATCKNINATDEILSIGAEDDDFDVRLAVFENVNASTDILRIGAQDDDFGIVAEVMKHHNATPEILMVGAKTFAAVGYEDERMEILINVMQNENATPEILKIGAKCKEFVMVREAVMCHNKVTPEILMIGAKDETNFVKKTTMRNQKATVDILMVGLDSKEPEVMVDALKNKNANEKMLMIGAKDDNWLVVLAAMSNPNAGTEILMIGAKSQKFSVVKETMANPNAGTEILRIGAESVDAKIREVVMKNINASPEILMIGAHDEETDVILATMSNVKATPDILMIGAKDEEPEVRYAAVKNKNANKEVCKIVAQDEIDDIKYIALDKLKML